MKAYKRICDVCGETSHSSENTCYSCRKGEDLRTDLNLENKTQDELLTGLKVIFEQENREKMFQLNLLFEANHFLSADFILGALMEKLERDMEEDEIDSHMKESANQAWDLTNKMYVAWLGW